MFSIFGKKKNNIENQRDEARTWRRKLNAEIRSIERQIREIEDEQRRTFQELKQAKQREDVVSQRILATEVARSRKGIEKLQEAKAVLSSLGGCIDSSISTMRIVNNMKDTSNVIRQVNEDVKAPQVAATIRDFEREMGKISLAHEAIQEAQEEIDDESVSDVLREVSGQSVAMGTKSQMSKTSVQNFLESVNKPKDLSQHFQAA